MANDEGTVLITGANGGLGSAFVSQFLNSPEASIYTGLFAVRNPSTATTLQSIVSSSPNASSHEIMALDISTLASIRSAAKTINERVAFGSLPKIRVLVLNAAIQSHKGVDFTKDGLETNFGINYLANFLLVLLVLRSIDKEHGRIVIISSWTHDPFDPRNEQHIKLDEQKTIFTDAESLAKPAFDEEKNLGKWELWEAGMRRYGMSKTLMQMFMFELQRRLNSDPELKNICVLSLDPGGMGTGIARDGPWLLRFLLAVIFPVFGPLLRIWNHFWPNGMVRTPDISARDLRRACFDQMEPLGKFPKAVAVNGSEVGAHQTPEVLDEKKQKALWEESLRHADVRDGDTVLKNWE
jgi:NAD(P)-dependent dehydrogenase (short-subunit alcohol dehydrogenase family)